MGRGLLFLGSTLTVCSFLLGALLMGAAPAHAVSCESVAKSLNAQLQSKINESELSEMLVMLNATRNRELPAKFITKNKARSAGWSPGRDLWSIKALKGKSIGGDGFGNFENRLPKGKWREADLDYQGGKRGAKRLVYSTDGKRMITVNHYQTFVEVPACR